MPFYANVFDLTELDRVARMIVGDWFDKDPRTLEPRMIDGEYLPIRGSDGEQIQARADILIENFGVRVQERSR